MKDLKHLSDIMTSIEVDSDISVVERTREILQRVEPGEIKSMAT